MSLIRSWVNLSDRGVNIKGTQDKFNQVEQQQDELKRKLASVESREYVEKEARDKLNLGKEGEVAVVAPSVSPVAEPTPTPFNTSTNWQKWVRLFF